MFARKSIQVLVVGAGPVGLLAALSLKRHGVEVRIIDKSNFSNAESYALAIHPSGLTILDELGLLGEIVHQGRPIDQVEFYDGETAIVSVPYGVLETSTPFALALPQSRLEGILINALKQEGVSVEWNRELDELVAEDDGYTARIHVLEETAQGYATSDMRRVPTHSLDVHASIIIGADGLHSTVARLIGSRRTLTEARRAYLVYEYQGAREIPSHQVVVKTGSLWNVLWPMPEHRARVSFEIPREDHTPPSPGLFRSLVAERFPSLDVQGFEIRWCGRVEFAPGYATPFAQGGVFLVGDAAHFANPFGVQSMNGGLVEAAYLASMISEYKERGELHLVSTLYDGNRRGYWKNLLEGHRDAMGGTNNHPWVRENASDVMGAIPASGRYLQTLFSRLSPMGEPAGRK